MLDEDNQIGCESSGEAQQSDGRYYDSDEDDLVSGQQVSGRQSGSLDRDDQVQPITRNSSRDQQMLDGDDQIWGKAHEDSWDEGQQKSCNQSGMFDEEDTGQQAVVQEADEEVSFGNPVSAAEEEDAALRQGQERNRAVRSEGKTGKEEQADCGDDAAHDVDNDDDDDDDVQFVSEKGPGMAPRLK